MSINRELSQLASFIDVQESNNFIGISTAGTYTVGIGTSSVLIGTNGIITATQFNGPTGSSLIDHIDLQDEGNLVGTGFTTLNFVGTAVTITQGVTGVATITVDSAVVGGEDGAVQFASGGTLTGISTLLFADSTNHRVGIGSSSPTAKLDVGGTVNVSGISTFQGDVFLGDNDELTFGDGNDLLIYSNGTNGIIRTASGSNLIIRSATHKFRNQAGTEELAVFTEGGSVDLYYANSKKFETTGIGVSIVGTGNTATITGPENLVLDPAAVGDATGKVIIFGDLQVDGTTTEINSTTLTVDDKSIVLASGAADSAAANGAGIEIDGASATLQYASTGDKWVFNKAPYYNTNRILTTADEGSGNGIDADTLDGQEGTYYLDYSNFVGVATDSSLLSGISSTSFLRSDIADVKTSGNLKFNDSVEAQFGNDGDLQLWHNGGQSYISNITGTLNIRTTSSAGDINLLSDDDVGIMVKGRSETAANFIADGAVELYYDDSKKFETTGYGVTIAGGINVSGISTFANDVKYTSATTGLGVFYDRSADTLKLLEDGSDNTKLTIGDNSSYSSYMQIYHDGGNSGIGYINYAGSNQMVLSGNKISLMNTARSENMLVAIENNAVFLYYDNSLKFQTTGYGVTIAGGINVSGIATAQDFNSASDENLKTNIRTIEDPLAKVVQIRGVNFDWKENQRPALGVIAQEVEKVLPELVTDLPSSGTKTVNYNGLIGLLIEAVKAQQEEIDMLKSKIK